MLCLGSTRLRTVSLPQHASWHSVQRRKKLNRLSLSTCVIEPFEIMLGTSVWKIFDLSLAASSSFSLATAAAASFSFAWGEDKPRGGAFTTSVQDTHPTLQPPNRLDTGFYGRLTDVFAQRRHHHHGREIPPFTFHSVSRRNGRNSPQQS